MQIKQNDRLNLSLLKLSRLLFEKGGKNDQRVIGPGEKANRISLSKTLIVKKDLEKGDKVSYSNIDFYPSGEGLTPAQFKDFNNKKLIKNIKSGNILSKDFQTSLMTTCT